jgi:hypothetical protein
MEFLKNTNKTASTIQKNEHDFEKQKNDALKQFEKLYSNFGAKPENNKQKKEEKSPPQKSENKKLKAKFKKNTAENFMNIFFKDQDKTLIIILIIILMDNEENLTLVMALIYLLT